MIDMLIESPAGQIKHGDVRNKINEIISAINRPDLASFGYATYSDSVSEAAPVAASAGELTEILIDGLGQYTEEQNLPNGISSLFSLATKRIDLSSLKVGDTVSIRYTADVTAGINNQTFYFYLLLGEGTTSEFIIPIGSPIELKDSTKEFPMSFYTEIYIGSLDVLQNAVKLLVTTDNAYTVRNRGLFIKATRRGL